MDRFQSIPWDLLDYWALSQVDGLGLFHSTGSFRYLGLRLGWKLFHPPTNTIFVFSLCTFIYLFLKWFWLWYPRRFRYFYIYIITILLLRAFRNLKLTIIFLKYFIIYYFCKKKIYIHNIHFPCSLVFRNIFTILFFIRFDYIIKKILFKIYI